MKKARLFLLLSLIPFLMSCGTMKEGFSSGKKNSNDEFLVEKKSPLVMPPNYNELPIPKENIINNNGGQSEIKALISEKNKNKENSKKLKDLSVTFEESLIEKIKNN
jgi:hypothetical protein